MPKIAANDFINNAEVQECLQQLEKAFGKNGKNLVVSDVIDSDNHQYVNLVQKGGGVLGVALVGYTYILEQMGIRFIRLAGTSAGAVNTALMTVVGATATAENGIGKGRTVKGNKKLAKSEKVLQLLCDLNFFDLVDGHPVARWIIKKFITHKDFAKRLTSWIKWILFILATLPLVCLLFLGLQHQVPVLSSVTKIVFVVTGLYVMGVAILAFYMGYLLQQLKNAGFGINPGDFFYSWIKDRLTENGVHTVSDLMNVAATPVPDLQLRKGVEGNLDGLEGDVTFITSELVTQNKIEFPKMWELFRKDKDELQPAGFIRSSMAIPFFFESYFVTDIPCSDAGIKKQWEEKLGETDPPSVARFVDGGILSNFPINLFYNANVNRPRLPSFGIDLDDTITPEAYFTPDNVQAADNRNAAGTLKSISGLEDAGMRSQSWSLGGYIYRMFNTIRFYYDKDFLIKNNFFKRGIGTVPLKEFGWLNFCLTDEDKLKMFVLGARAATKFLLGFKWDEYKNQRHEMQQQLTHPTDTVTSTSVSM